MLPAAHSSRCYDLLGTPLRVSCSDATLHRSLATILHHKGVAPARASSRPSPPAFSLTALRVSTLPTLPDAAQHLGQLEQVAVDVWREGARVFFSGGGGWVIADPPDVQLLIPPSLAVCTPRGPTRTLTHLVGGALLTLLHSEDRFPLHAAVLTRGGRGLVLLAASDAGKSTAAFQLVRQGWSYVSDDNALLHAGRDGVEATTLRPAFCLDTDMAQHFPELATRPWPLMERDEAKWRIDVEALYPGCFVPTTRPVAIVQPAITNAATSTLTPVPAADLLPSLLHQSGFGLTTGTPSAPAHFERVGQLLRQCATYRLASGRDVLVDGPAFDRRLRPLVVPPERVSAG
jgi:hypothetical protein